MAIQNTDKFLVSRSDINYQTEAQNLMAIQDTDLLMVQRGSDLYKISGSDLKSYAGAGYSPDFAKYWLSSSTGYGTLATPGSIRQIYHQTSLPTSLSMSYDFRDVFFGIKNSNLVSFSSGNTYTYSFSGGSSLSEYKKFIMRLKQSLEVERYVLYQNGELYRNISTNYYDTTGSLTLIDTNVVNINSINYNVLIYSKTDGSLKYIGPSQTSGSVFGTQTQDTFGSISISLPSGTHVKCIQPLHNTDSAVSALAVLLNDGSIYRWGSLGGTRTSLQLYSPSNVSFRSISGVSHTGTGGIFIAISTSNEIYGYSNNEWAGYFGLTSTSAPISLAGGTLNTTAYSVGILGISGLSGGSQAATTAIMLQKPNGELYCATGSSGSTTLIQLSTSLDSPTFNSNLFGFLPECTNIRMFPIPGSGSGEWYTSADWIFV